MMENLEKQGHAAGPRWRLGCAQDIGARRQQQDSLGAREGSFRGRPVLLAVLADGMGGMKNGAAFSRIAVDYHLNHFQEALDAEAQLPRVLLTLALGANEQAHRIYEPESPGGTTLVSALLTDEGFYTLSVGDSRIYLFRELGGAQRRLAPLQLNREHVFGPTLDELAWMGAISHADAENSRYREALNSAVGERNIRRLDLTPYPTRMLAGDRLVLMSDGIYRSATEGELAEALLADPSAAADSIVRHICDRKLPQQDNMSLIILEMESGREE